MAMLPIIRRQNYLKIAWQFCKYYKEIVNDNISSKLDENIAWKLKKLPNISIMCILKKRKIQEEKKMKTSFLEKL